MKKTYSFSVDLKATGSGIVEAESLKEAIEKVLEYDDLSIEEVEYDLPYGFHSFGTDKDKAYELGISEIKPFEKEKK